jgi:hypothetical protein
MKKSLSNHVLNSGITFLMMLLVTSTGCKKEISHAEFQMTFQDGSTESVHLGNDAVLLIWQGPFQYLIRTKEMKHDCAELEIVKTSFTTDTVQRIFTIKKENTSVKHFDLKKGEELDGTDGPVKVSLNNVVALETEKPPAVCYGNTACCTATCFTTTCCTGSGGPCKDAACDCKPTGPCPNDPPKPGLHHFAELFDASKNLVTAKME